MSVDYNAILVRGWRVSSEDHVEMNETSEYKYEDEFTVSNGYVYNPDYVFGERVITLECNGEIWPVDNDEIDDMRKMCCPDYWQKALIDCGRPDLAMLQPQLFFVGQVC